MQQAAASAVRASLQANFSGTTVEAVDAVGATVSSELFRDGLTALGVAMLAMLVYIWFRFEWQFGVAATMTLLLDITKIVGFYALIQFQFNATSIVAILTIMGYSINDKVVVYDRVRENLRLFRRMSLRELIDRSINETLSRTIATSGTVFLAILPLALMSTGDIQAIRHRSPAGRHCDWHVILDLHRGTHPGFSWAKGRISTARSGAIGPGGAVVAHAR